MGEEEGRTFMVDLFCVYGEVYTDMSVHTVE